MFCDTRYLLYWIATKVLCFCVISSIELMCGFYSMWPRARTAQLLFQRQAQAVSFGPTNHEENLHQSEWVTHLHIGVPAKNLFQHFTFPWVLKKIGNLVPNVDKSLRCSVTLLLSVVYCPVKGDSMISLFWSLWPTLPTYLSFFTALTQSTALQNYSQH